MGGPNPKPPVGWMAWYSFSGMARWNDQTLVSPKTSLSGGAAAGRLERCQPAKVSRQSDNSTAQARMRRDMRTAPRRSHEMVESLSSQMRVGWRCSAVSVNFGVESGFEVGVASEASDGDQSGPLSPP